MVQVDRLVRMVCLIQVFRVDMDIKGSHCKASIEYIDSVFGKRVLTYWENRGTPDHSQINGFMVGIENYIFL